MIKNETDFDSLVELLRKNNGLTKKNSERFIVDLISNKEKKQNLEDVLKRINNDYSICGKCFYYAHNNICDFCDNSERNQNIICVVSTMLDAKNIEEKGKYNGLYAILGGEISLVKSISPENLNIEQIFKRTNDNTELILALNATFEGEVTANYIAKIAASKNVKVSRIAKGIPMGGMLDYADETTLRNAIENRKKYGGQ